MLLGLTNGAGPILKKHASKHPYGGSKMMVQPRTSKCSAVACGGSGSRAQAPSRQRPSSRAASLVTASGTSAASGPAVPYTVAGRQHNAETSAAACLYELGPKTSSDFARRVWLTVPAGRNECRAPSPRMRFCSNLANRTSSLKALVLVLPVQAAHRAEILISAAWRADPDDATAATRVQAVREVQAELDGELPAWGTTMPSLTFVAEASSVRPMRICAIRRRILADGAAGVRWLAGAGGSWCDCAVTHFAFAGCSYAGTSRGAPAVVPTTFAA